MLFPLVKPAIPFEKTELPTHLAFKSNADVDITFGLAIILNGKPYLPKRIAVLPVFLGFYDLVWTISHMFGIVGFIRRDDIRRDESRLYEVDGCQSQHYVLITIPSVETRFIASNKKTSQN